jgi:hypothetical protein
MTRATNKRLWLWITFFFVALIGCIPLSSYIERHEQDYRWIGGAVRFRASRVPVVQSRPDGVVWHETPEAVWVSLPTLQ